MSVSDGSKNYAVLAWVLAGLNALSLAVAALFYAVQPAALASLLSIEIIAGLNLAVMLYFASVHQLIKKKLLIVSTGLMAIMTAASLGLVIIQTGGLDSPFYAFWLLGVVAAGLFGTPAIMIGLVVTLSGTAVAFASHNFAASYMTSKLGQLLITLFATGLAEWIHTRDRQMITAPAANNGTSAKPSIASDILMSQMSDGVIVIDAKGLITLINHAAEEMTGWDAGSAMGISYRSVLDLKTAKDQPATGEDDPFYKSGLEQKRLVSDTLLLYSRSGHKFAASISVSPITNSTGTLTGYVAVIRDISRQKEADRQRSEFISTASHEMRTPVAAIEGYIALAMNPKVATIDTRAMEYLNKAHENTQHLGALFRDLLSVTKLEEGTARIQLAPVNISELLKDVIADMQLIATKKNLAVTYSSAAAGGNHSVMPIYYVMAEPERLREVVSNLIDNAIKFTSSGGVTVGLSADQKLVTVRIADTGPGISAENIKHLFQKFYRVDNSATRTIGGTGLGLYLARTIIELFNGRIWVESEIGKGSSFNFSLVRTQPTVQTAPTRLQPSQVIAPTPANILTPTPVTPDIMPRPIDGLRPSTKA
jgi:PAS domain S-box-containing protein